MFFTKEKQQNLIDAQNDVIDLKSITLENLNNLIRLREENATLIARIEIIEQYIKEFIEIKQRQSSDEPFIQVLSSDFTEKDGIELKIDWNQAMINFLKRNGYIGVDEEEIVEKYIADLFRNKTHLNIQA